MTAAQVCELGQERQKEDRRLGIEQIDDETVAEQPPAMAGRGRCRFMNGFGLCKELPQAQPDQIGRACIFDDAERHGR